MMDKHHMKGTASHSRQQRNFSIEECTRTAAAHGVDVGRVKVGLLRTVS